VILEPDVSVTDYLLTLETGTFAWLLYRHPSPTALHRLAALIFATLALSSLTGGTYHGFFPEKTATPGGWAVWIATMLLLGVAASLTWAFVLLLRGIRLARRILLLLAALFALYAFVVLFVDYSFRTNAIFAAPPLLALLAVVIVRVLRDRSPNAAMGAAGILLMLLAGVLQQMHVGLHPVWFNHNALYHLLDGAAMAALFVAIRRADPSLIQGHPANAGRRKVGAAV
jgi:hypothetical protein